MIVDVLGADVVGVAFDLDVGAVRVRLQLLHELIELGPDVLGNRRLTELEVALLFVQDDFVDNPLGRLLDRVGAGVDRGRGRAGRVSGPACSHRALIGGRGCLTDFGDLRLVGAGPLLRLLERARQRVDLVVDLADFASHELLGRARRRSTEGQARATVPPARLSS